MKIYWTKEMEQVIIENWKIKTDEELAAILGTTKHSIEKKRTRMGLNRQKEKAIPVEVINYAIELVKSGKTYVEAAKETSMKFNTHISITTIIRHCEKTNVLSKQSQNIMANKDGEEKYKRLEAYNARLFSIRKKIKIGDKIEIVSRGNSEVVEKYPNFVVCIVNGFREAILYTEIKRIVKNTV